MEAERLDSHWMIWLRRPSNFTSWRLCGRGSPGADELDDGFAGGELVCACSEGLLAHAGREVVVRHDAVAWLEPGSLEAEAGGEAMQGIEVVGGIAAQVRDGVPAPAPIRNTLLLEVHADAAVDLVDDAHAAGAGEPAGDELKVLVSRRDLEALAQGAGEHRFSHSTAALEFGELLVGGLNAEDFGHGRRRTWVMRLRGKAAR